MAELLLTERDDDIAVLTFNDPDRRNAMSRAMGEAFRTAVAKLVGDDSLRCVVLTGAGRAFSAGGDFKMLTDLAEDGRARPGLARPRMFIFRCTSYNRRGGGYFVRSTRLQVTTGGGFFPKWFFLVM